MNGTDEYVCVNCFTDGGLIRFVEENVAEHDGSIFGPEKRALRRV